MNVYTLNVLICINVWNLEKSIKYSKIIRYLNNKINFYLVLVDRKLNQENY